MSSLTLFDTLSRRKRVFEPINPDRVTLYVCGPTVYNYAHIGNARPAVVFDTLFRVLRHFYGEDQVVYARNITDVDDKIIAASVETGVPIGEITEKYARIYREDMGALGVMPPSLEPCATEHIPEMIAMIETLVAGGFAYEADGHVLFEVSKYEDYGKLSRRSLDDMIAGARVEVASYKRDPADFVLWKPAKENEPGWDSPWGRGRPGWHLECSAMSAKHLGKRFDIHGGGADLVFPHHENEIAQSRCTHGNEAMANYWLHNGFLTMGTDKMSKSLGNVQLVHDLAEEHPGEVLRYALLTAHYRAPLTWTKDLLAKTRRSLDRVYGVLRRLSHIEAAEVAAPQAFLDTLLDDLNTPKAISALFQITAAANKAETDDAKALAKGQLLAAGRLMGLAQGDPDQWFGLTDMDPAERDAVDALIVRRNKARANKDWDEADAVRDELNTLNIQVDDGPEGSTWRKAG